MKIKLLITAIAASVLGGCVVVPEGHGHHGGWHDHGYYGHRHYEREGHRW